MMLSLLKNKKWWFVGAAGFIVVFLFLYAPLLKGAANYWDWSVPYFSDGLKNIYTDNASSWLNASFGAPLGSLTFLNFYFIYSLFSFLRPEVFSFFLLLFISVTVTLTVFNFCLKMTSNKIFSVLVSLSAILNPGVFYKLLAGHFGHFISYCLFVLIVYYTIFKYKGRPKEIFVLSLLIALSGAQIHYFLFVLIYIMLYSLFFQRIAFKKLVLLFSVTLLVNLPWLSNFIVGAVDFNKVASVASSNKFKALYSADWWAVINQTFSKATFIHHFYGDAQLIGLSTFTIISFLSILFGYKKNKKMARLLGSLILVFGFLATGIFHNFNIPVLRSIYPMFREAGHFTLPLILFEVLAIGSLGYRVIENLKYAKFAVGIFLLAYLVVNIREFKYYLYDIPSPNFSHVRDLFQPYKQFYDKYPGSDRFLTYPFFGQYSFGDVVSIYSPLNRFPLNNSGWDNFTNFTNVENVNNSLVASEFRESLQYKFAQTKDINLLKEKGIGYLVDYSAIYESNYERYVDRSIFDHNLSLIKNNPDFIKEVEEKNPGSIEQVYPKIYKIKDSKPRVFSSADQGRSLFKKFNPTYYAVKLENVSESDSLIFLDNFNSGWHLYPLDKQYFGACDLIESNAGECAQGRKPLSLREQSLLFAKPLKFSHSKHNDWANTWKIETKNIPSGNYVEKNSDGSVNIYLSLYFKPQGYFLISQLISVLTLLASFLMIVYYWMKEKNSQEKKC